MRRKNYACRILAVAMAFIICACGNDFRLDEVSTEITLGQGTTTIPLGYLNDRTLGNMLGGDSIDGIVVDPETGEYSISYDGQRMEFEIEGMVNSFSIPEMVNNFDVEYPSFDMEATTVEIHQKSSMKVDMGDLSEFGQKDKYVLPEGVALPMLRGELHETIEEKNIHMVVPDQIDKVVQLFFSDIESGHKGAPLHIRLDMEDLKAVNAGGELTLDVKLDGGDFVMCDAQGKQYYNEYSTRYDLAAGEGEIDFVLYVERVDNIAALNVDHELDIPLQLTYSLAFDMATRPGSYTLNTMPALTVDADFEFGDADVLLNGGVSFVESHPAEPAELSFGNLPAEVKSIKQIELADDATITLFAAGLEWLDECDDSVEISLALPAYFVLRDKHSSDYDYDQQRHMLTSTLDALVHGLEISLAAIDLGEGGATPKDGELKLSYMPEFEAHFAEGAEVFISELMHDDELNVVLSTGIESTQLAPLSICGSIDYKYEQTTSMELGDIMGDSGFEMEGATLSPVIVLNLSNPLTIDSQIALSLMPVNGGVADADNAVSFSDVALTPATHNGTSIVNSDITIVLAGENHRAEYDDGTCTFVACDAGKLFGDSMPEAITMNISLATNPAADSVLYIDDEYTFSYTYGMDMPLTVGKGFRLGYSDTIEGLADTFAQLGGYNLKVGDVALILKSRSTIPMQFAFDAQTLDASGNPTAIRIGVPEGGALLGGSKDGVTEVESETRLEFYVPDGDLSAIADIDALRFDFEALGVSDKAVSLSEEQKLSIKLQLEVAGGITIDLESL